MWLRSWKSDKILSDKSEPGRSHTSTKVQNGLIAEALNNTDEITTKDMHPILQQPNVDVSQ